MYRKLKLYGDLANFIGTKEFSVIAHNIPQAISFLINNFPDVEAYMNIRKYIVKVGSYEITKNEINYPIGKKEDIHIVPVIAGSGSVGRAILGGALIAVSFGAFGAFGAKALTLKGGFAAAGLGAKATFGIGAGLLLSGVSEMLFPLPKPMEFDSTEDPRVSFNFAGTQNTARAGTPVPIVYGEIITGSVVISGSVDTEQVQV